MDRQPPSHRPGQQNPSSTSAAHNSPAPSSSRPQGPQHSNTTATDVTAASDTRDPAAGGGKKKKHRAGKKRRNRRQSFAAPQSDVDSNAPAAQDEARLNVPGALTRPLGRTNQFYGMATGARTGTANLSSTSLDSQALLDHRDQPVMRPRRESRPQNVFGTRGSPQVGTSYQQGQDYMNPFVGSRPRYQSHVSSHDGSDDEDQDADDRTPLIGTSHRERHGGRSTGYGIEGGVFGERRSSKAGKQSDDASSNSPKHTRFPPNRSNSALHTTDYHVNNPPSMPGSPNLGPDMGYDDVIGTGFGTSRSPDDRRATIATGDHLIDIDDEPRGLPSPDPRAVPELQRRRTIAGTAEEDVCFPVEGMSEIAEEDFAIRDQGATSPASGRRRRRRRWPDLSVLEDWSREEKEERSEGSRAKKVSEPMFVGGRLRASKVQWHREEEDAPYRFTYFNEEFQSTIHSQTISELAQPGGSFRELFIPDPPELEESSSSESEDDLISTHEPSSREMPLSPTSTEFRNGTRNNSVVEGLRPQKTKSPNDSGDATPSKSPQPGIKPKRYGPRPTWWLDVLSPTDQEMRVIAKTFGIHALTAEDIMMQEAREKVELFRHYYFINYRSFEQDMNSEDFLEPINMYVIVFREGVVSFHFSLTPHPANVRRRIRQLKDYLILSSDWISYAIIDDVTDTYAPLIQGIEDEVDDIDETILKLHSSNENIVPTETSDNKKSWSEKASDVGDSNVPSGGDMLRRVGTCRKKVMGLYRLLGNKADVIKGFAKRCNEQWEVAPKSEIGLYLGDIQDHILTMTSNLSHYETLLSRAHSNYLAQITIRMNERQEQSADVLGKLTVLGTIVLPMNIICGMWGMNVKVPGQEVDNLIWFWSITAGLVCFAVVCFVTAKRVYGIV